MALKYYCTPGALMITYIRLPCGVIDVICWI